jgi:hypothetical protein
MKTELIHIRLEPELKAHLQKLADKEHRKLGDYIRYQLITATKYTAKKK